MVDGDRLVLDAEGLRQLQDFLNSKINDGTILCMLITEASYGPQTTLAVKLLQEKVNRLDLKDSGNKPIELRTDGVLDLATVQAFVIAKDEKLLNPLPKPLPVIKEKAEVVIKSIDRRLVLGHPPILGHAPAYNYGARRDEYTTEKGEVVEAHSHRGVDIFCRLGTQVYSATSGEVVKVEIDPGGKGGNYIVIRDPGGFYHHYMHLGNDMKVSLGNPVTAGKLIGSVSRTGLARGSTSPTHLHYEIRKGINSGSPVNPTIALREAYNQYNATALLPAR